MPVVTIEKLVFGGQALARDGEKVCFIWGAFPGETVEFEVTKKKKNFIEGVVTKIITASPDRLQPKEKHYLSCSPWQALSFEKENFWKKEISLETYARVAGIKLDTIDLVTDNVEWGYRNKIEYSFALSRRSSEGAKADDTESGEVTLSFFERGKHYRAPIDPCALATPAINACAEKILAWVRAEKIPLRSLKSIIIRSNRQGEVIAGLFIKDRLELGPKPDLGESVRGFHIYYSDHRSPASIISDTLYTEGDTFLTETVADVPLRYGLNSFFQVNLPVFEKAVADIARFAEGEIIVDYYAGVGSIGLPLAKQGKQVTLVEINSEAVAFAEENIRINTLSATAHEAPSEKMLEFITRDSTVIVDPPRMGLDPRVVEKILAEKPKRLIYLSCEIATQARDLALLKTVYKPVFWQLYNFFPKTPHIEGLVVLER